MWITDEFESQLRKDLKDDNINGSISAAIVQKNKIIWSNTFGPLNQDGNIAADADTIYRVGSVTKPFTAFLMMQFVQDGKIELDDPIETHLPEIRELEGYSDSTRITFRQLASHTSGLRREPKLEKADSGPIEEWENKVLLSIPKTSFEFTPGEKFSYSNIGYAILGVVLSRVANGRFIELIEERILKPLHMDNSFFAAPIHKLGSVAQGIGGGPFGDDELDLEGPKREHGGRGYKVPNGGLYSTPTDLANFLMSNMGSIPLLDEKYLGLLHTKQTPEPSRHGYGFGFELYQDQTITIAGHSGGVWGYTSFFGFEKTYGFGLILLRNYNWGTTSWDFAPKIILRKLVEFENSVKDTNALDKTTK